MVRKTVLTRGAPWPLAALAVAVVMAAPLASPIAAFWAADEGAWQHLVETRLGVYVLNSLALAVLTALISGVIGVGCGWLVAATEFPGRKLIGALLVLPLAAPAYILAYFYADLLGDSGAVQSWLRGLTGREGGASLISIRNLPGAAVVLGVSLYPYVYLLARRAFEQRSAETFLAARTLGDGPFGAFWRIALPAARPAIAGGLVLVMMETFADFGVADHFAVPTFSTGIFRSWLLMGDQVAALRLSGVLLIFVAVLIWLEARSRADGQRSVRSQSPAARMTLAPPQAVGVIALCLVPVLLGFGIPALGFLWLTIDADVRGPAVISLLTNTLGVALIVAVIATVLAVLLAFSARFSTSRIVKGATRLATLGYAMPGALLAVGLLAPLGQADQSVTRFLANNLGWTGGLVLTGSLLALVYACTVRFLTVSFNSAQAGLSLVPPELETAARSLGDTPFAVLRRVQLPLMAPHVVAGALLVMIDVIRELPVTLILRPFGFETLSTSIHRLASDERLAEAAGACLMLQGLGLALVLVVLWTERGLSPRGEPAR